MSATVAFSIALHPEPEFGYIEAYVGHSGVLNRFAP